MVRGDPHGTTREPRAGSSGAPRRTEAGAGGRGPRREGPPRGATEQAEGCGGAPWRTNTPSSRRAPAPAGASGKPENPGTVLVRSGDGTSRRGSRWRWPGVGLEGRWHVASRDKEAQAGGAGRAPERKGFAG